MASKGFSFKQKMKKLNQSGKKYSSAKSIPQKKVISLLKRSFRHFLPIKFLPIKYLRHETSKIYSISRAFKTASMINHISKSFSLIEEAEKLVGLYDQGKIFASRYGIQGGFRIKSNKLNHLLDGTITKISKGVGGNFQITVNFYDQFELTGLKECAITLKRISGGATMTWNKIGC